ncbi:MAG TPA: hypothetical protein VK697_00580, partial [Methylomirabilota bacterium]|nr:hypothetical protein [Methylomirabilota bacterium]
VAAFRDDAAAIASAARPSLSPGRSVAILADVLRPPKSSPKPRGLAAAALVLVVGTGVALAVLASIRSSDDSHIAVRSTPSNTSVTDPSAKPTSGPTDSASLSPHSPVGTPRPADPASAGALPVRGSGQELGTQIRMAPGPDSDLYVSIPKPPGSVLVTQLDSVGHPRPGWPIVVSQTTSCEQLLPVADGSVRLLCTLENRGAKNLAVVRAYAFGSKGRALAGWPIDLDRYGGDGYFAARVIDDELTLATWKSLGNQVNEGQPTGNAWIATIAADGTVRAGVKVQYGGDCCSNAFALGPDGVAYGTIRHFGETASAPRSSQLIAVSSAGVPAGFPLAVAGIASVPAFDAVGRIHLNVNDGPDRLTRTLVLDTKGQMVVGGSDQLGFSATDQCVAIEGSCEVPAAPLVEADGTTFVVGAFFNTTMVAGLSPSGKEMTGWPYRSDAGHQSIGICPAGEVCEGYGFAAPTMGPGNVLYLLHAAASKSAGGSIVAVGQDGRVVAGWPVSLKRAGSEVWSAVVGPDGNAYALAIEPEPNNGHSATILALAPDSKVRYTTTIIDP